MLYGWQGGNDWFLGGSGRDGLSSGEGDDIIEGGTEGDLLFGAEGDDQLFGETKGEMEDLVTAGETAPSINEQGDLISGGTGDDLLYGSNRNDALFGGAGSDLLAGGGKKINWEHIAWSIEKRHKDIRSLQADTNADRGCVGFALSAIRQLSVGGDTCITN